MSGRDGVSIRAAAKRLLRRRRFPSDKVFHLYFGVYSNTAAAAFRALNTPRNVAKVGFTSMKSLLYALYFLRRYPAEADAIAVFHSATPMRKVSWKVVRFLVQVLPRVRYFFVVFFTCNLTSPIRSLGQSGRSGAKPKAQGMLQSLTRWTRKPTFRQKLDSGF